MYYPIVTNDFVYSASLALLTFFWWYIGLCGVVVVGVVLWCAFSKDDQHRDWH